MSISAALRCQSFILLTVSSQSCHYARLSGPRLPNSSVFKSRLVVQLLELPIEAEKVHCCEIHRKKKKMEEKK